jgi:hypothetical protein
VVVAGAHPAAEDDDTVLGDDAGEALARVRAAEVDGHAGGPEPLFEQERPGAGFVFDDEHVRAICHVATTS